jgi:long-chain acyl-CoA synthetase
MKSENNFELSELLQNFPSFSEILNYTAGKNPNQPFLVVNQESLTYEQFNIKVNQCSHFLYNLGVKPKDILSAILRNSLDYLILYFACIRCRIVFNPFPYHLHAKEILKKVASSDVNILVCHNDHFTELTSSKTRLINLDDIDSKPLMEVLSQYSGEPFDSPELTDNQTAILYYSSGTTGNPKLIEYTHRSMVTSQASMVRAGYVNPFEKHLCVLPLGHTAALRHTIKPCICTGSTVYLYESFWKIRNDIWDLVEQNGINFFNVVPTILIAMMNMSYSKFSQDQIRTMKFIACSSAFLPRKLQTGFQERYGVPVINLYGCSEIGAAFFDNPLVPGWKPFSVGKPFDVFQAAIFNEKKEVVASGINGEIGVAGSGVLKGYLNDPDAFQNSMHRGYFMTGDLGYIDTDGFFHYVDRKKDIIIKAGVNIAPSQIDELLQSHPSVYEAATIGKRDSYLGETIKSFIILKKNQAVEIKDLLSFCKAELGDFKTPSEIEFVESLPKGPSGKILKRELRVRDES